MTFLDLDLDLDRWTSRSAEKRLEELSPRITPVEQNVAPALDSIPSVTTPDLTSFLSLDPSEWARVIKFDRRTLNRTT